MFSLKILMPTVVCTYINIYIKILTPTVVCTYPNNNIKTSYANSCFETATHHFLLLEKNFGLSVELLYEGLLFCPATRPILGILENCLSI